MVNVWAAASRADFGVVALVRAGVGHAVVPRRRRGAFVLEATCALLLVLDEGVAALLADAGGALARGLVGYARDVERETVGGDGDGEEEDGGHHEAGEAGLHDLWCFLELKEEFPTGGEFGSGDPCLIEKTFVSPPLIALVLYCG